MSTTDLDRYLSEEVVREAALAAWPLTGGQDSRTEKVRASLSAVLPDIIQQAKAEALREAATAYQTGGWADDLPAGGSRPALILGMSQRAVAWLRARADRIEHDACCPHPKCPGGGLCCCLSEQGGQP